MQLMMVNHDNRKADVIMLDVEVEMKQMPMDDAEFGKTIREQIAKSLTHIQ